MKAKPSLTLIAVLVSFLLTGVTMPVLAKSKVVERPQYLVSNALHLDVARIVLTDTATVLTLYASHADSWIRITSNTVLRDNNGREYKLRSAHGIELDKYVPLSSPDGFEMRLALEPVDKAATSVDFVEPVDRGFRIYKIQLKGGKLPKLQLPGDIKKKPVDTTSPLPQPKYEYGVGTLRGQILDFQPDMEGMEVEVCPEGMFWDFENRTTTRVGADGSFTVSFPIAVTTPLRVSVPLYRFAIPCWIGPSDTTRLYLNTREYTRRISHFHSKEPSLGRMIYVEGPLANVAEERYEYATEVLAAEANTQPAPSQLAKMSVAEYVNILKAQGETTKQAWNKMPVCAATKQYASLYVDLQVAHQSYFAANDIVEAYSRENPEAPRDSLRALYEHLVKDQPDPLSKEILRRANEPDAVYAEMYFFGLINVYMAQIPEKLNALGITEGALVDANNAQMIYGHVKQMMPLTPGEDSLMQQVALPQSYQDFIRVHNEEVLRKLEANKQKTDYRVIDVSQTKPEDTWAAILDVYKGKTVLVDFWATWCMPCREGHRRMAPLKAELKDKDIAFVYLTNETSPEETFVNMIPDIPGDHYRLTESQWKAVKGKFGFSSIPTYIIVSSEGKVTYQNSGFPGEDVLMEKLLAE